MTFRETIDWQWQDYSRFHEEKGNLLIHIFAVSLFWIGTLTLIWSVIGLSFIKLFAAVGTLFVSLILQSVGHKREANPPIPFAGKGDFVKRFICEQFVNFPRFVARGGWFKNFLNR